MPRIIEGTGGEATAPHPYGRVTNRIITRGMGPHINRLVTQGYGGPPRSITGVITRRIEFGPSGKKRRTEGLDEIIVWAKLVGVDGKPPPKKIEGFVRVGVNKDAGFARAMAEHVSTRVRQAWEDISIIVKRLK
jgi:hypothetical protein